MLFQKLIINFPRLNSKAKQDKFYDKGKIIVHAFLIVIIINAHSIINILAAL